MVDRAGHLSKILICILLRMSEVDYLSLHLYFFSVKSLFLYFTWFFFLLGHWSFSYQLDKLYLLGRIALDLWYVLQSLSSLKFISGFYYIFKFVSFLSCFILKILTFAVNLNNVFSYGFSIFTQAYLFPRLLRNLHISSGPLIVHIS